jgi:hypothetical protein
MDGTVVDHKEFTVNAPAGLAVTLGRADGGDERLAIGAGSAGPGYSV